MPISKCERLLEHRHMEVNCNIYNIGAPTFLVIFQSAVLEVQVHVRKRAIILHICFDLLQNCLLFVILYILHIHHLCSLGCNVRIVMRNNTMLF